MSIPTLERYLNRDGKFRQTSFRQAVQDIARKTTRLMLRWVMGLPQEDPALNGGIPWFRRYIYGLARLNPAWDQDQDEWSDISRCSLNAYQRRVDGACLGRLRDLINQWGKSLPHGDNRADWDTAFECLGKREFPNLLMQRTKYRYRCGKYRCDLKRTLFDNDIVMSANKI